MRSSKENEGGGQVREEYGENGSQGHVREGHEAVEAGTGQAVLYGVDTAQRNFIPFNSHAGYLERAMQHSMSAPYLSYEQLQTQIDMAHIESSGIRHIYPAFYTHQPLSSATGPGLHDGASLGHTPNTSHYGAAQSSALASGGSTRSQNFGGSSASALVLQSDLTTQSFGHDKSPNSLRSTRVGHAQAPPKIFECPMACGKTFKRKGDAERHSRVHTPPALFCHVRGCKYSGWKGFNRKDKLAEHLKKAHSYDYYSAETALYSDLAAY